MKYKIIIATLIFCIGVLVGIMLPFQCGRRADILNQVDTIQVSVSGDTVYASADTVYTDTVFVNTGIGQTLPRIKTSFLKDDSLIFISGFTLTNPPECSLVYLVKPINFDVYVYPDTVATSTVEGYNIQVNGNLTPLLIDRSGAFFYAGIAKERSDIFNDRYVGELGIGYNFGRLGVKVGIIDEYITTGIIYHF